MKNLILIFLFLTPFAHSFYGTSDKPTIQVGGSAEIKVAPDFVILSLGVETYNEKLEYAKEENDKIVKKILDLHEKYKIDQKYFKTNHLNVRPDSRRNNNTPYIHGYYVRKGISITLKDMNLYEKFLTDCVESGITHIHNVKFQTSELRKHRDQARKNAMKAAREKADDLAQVYGAKVGNPTSISEGSSHNNWWYNSWWGDNSFNMSQNSIQNVSSGAFTASEATALGQISISASVHVNFELLPADP